MKLLMTLLLSSMALAQAHKMANPADVDVPVPPPLATVNVVDVSVPNAPIHPFGTAQAYAKQISNNRVMTWIEPNGFQYQNVSDKAISKAKMQILLTDTRGHLDKITLLFNESRFTPGPKPLRPGVVATLMGEKVPGSDNHMGGSKGYYTQKEYDLKLYVTPTAKAEVLEVTFADGTTWKAK